MSNYLIIHGASANCGKTVTAVSFCRALVNRGMKVNPFKPVSVLDKKSFGIFNPVSHLCGAAKVPVTKENSPFTITPHHDKFGTLSYMGEDCCNVELLNRDKVLLCEVYPDISESIDNCFDLLLEKSDFVLCEGSSSPIDFYGVDKFDYANFQLVESRNCPILIVVRGIDGGLWSSLMGTIMNYPRSYRNNIIGYVINDVFDSGTLRQQVQHFYNETGIECLGVIPRKNRFNEEYESTPDVFEDEYSEWGEIGEEYLFIDKILERLDSVGDKSC